MVRSVGVRAQLDAGSRPDRRRRSRWFRTAVFCTISLRIGRIAASSKVSIIYDAALSTYLVSRF